MVRDLAHVVKREKAQMGVFITRAEPTKPMLTDAYRSCERKLLRDAIRQYPRLQIVTVEQLLNGKQPTIPFIDPSGLKKAAR